MEEKGNGPEAREKERETRVKARNVVDEKLFLYLIRA
jgi:hypothetical protein